MTVATDADMDAAVLDLTAVFEVAAVALARVRHVAQGGVGDPGQFFFSDAWIAEVRRAAVALVITTSAQLNKTFHGSTP